METNVDYSAPLIRKSTKTALIYNDVGITYEELLGNIERFSRQLELAEGDRGCLFAENRPEWIYAFYAVWSRGAINSAVDAGAGEEELLAVLEDCRPKVVFVSRKTAEVIEKARKKLSYRPQVLVLEEMAERFEAEAPLGAGDFTLPIDPEKTALILYTSGTTGEPKGVMLSFRSVYFNMQAVFETGLIDGGDVLLALFPFHHTVPLQGHVICPLYLGSTIVFVKSLTSDEILRLFNEYKVSLINGVPRLYDLFHRSIMNKVRSNPVARLLFALAGRIGKVETSKRIFKKVHDRFGGNIKVFLSGGAKLDGQVCRDFWTLGIPTIEGYGLTEMGPLISYNLMDAWKPGSAGRPVKGVDVRIEDGELLARGPGIMQGYLNKPEATQEIIRDGWVHTGDTAYIDDDGFIYLTGRKSERIVLASGKNLNPEEIEHVILEESDLIKEIALTEREGRILAYIHPDMELVKERGIHNLQEAVKWDVIDTYNRKVPEYRRILNFVLTPKELPKTAMGKIKRYRLQELLTEGGDSDKSRSRVPRLEEYRALADYLTRERGKTVSPESHLEIDAGLDSLELLELRVFIRKRFGLELAKDVFLHHPTLVRLAEHIRAVRNTGARPAAEEADGTVRRVEDFPLRRPNWLVKGLFLLISPLLSILFGIRRFRKNTDRFSKPAIIVSNHQSFLDPFILARTLPRRTLMDTYFLAKSRFFTSSIGKYFAERTNSILLDLHEPTESLFNRLMEILQKGKNIVIFPEGTRTFDGELGMFKKSFAVLSKKLGLPVVPVAISGAYESFPRTKLFPRPKRIAIRYFDPVHPDGKSVQEIVRDVRSTIHGGLS